MTGPPSLSQLSVSAGTLVGVTVGIVTQFLVQLSGGSRRGLNPFRLLLEPFTFTLILILFGLALAYFILQLHRLRRDSSTAIVRYIRWFSPGVFWPGALGVLIVNLLIGLIRALDDKTYFTFVFMFTGIFPFIVSLILLPLGMFVAKIVTRLPPSRI